MIHHSQMSLTRHCTFHQNKFWNV